MRPPPPSWAQGCWHSAEDRAAANSQQLPRASVSLITLKEEGCQHSPPPWLPPTALGSPMVEDTLPLTPSLPTGAGQCHPSTCSIPWNSVQHCSPRRRQHWEQRNIGKSVPGESTALVSTCLAPLGHCLWDLLSISPIFEGRCAGRQ